MRLIMCQLCFQFDLILLFVIILLNECFLVFSLLTCLTSICFSRWVIFFSKNRKESSKETGKKKRKERLIIPCAVCVARRF